MSVRINAKTDNVSSGINFIGFNQDGGCFAVGLNNGFRVYSTDPLKENEKMDFVNTFPSSVGYVDMLFRTNFIGVLGGGPNAICPANMCKIWDDVKRKFIIEFEYPCDVKAIRLRYDKFIVVLELMTKVYTFETLPQKLFTVETGPNPIGLCAICHNSSNPLMALPDKKMGKVTIINLTKYSNETTSPVACFTAHQNTLVAMSFNSVGTLLATASNKGTLIRIFNPLNGTKYFELRRGTNAATIYSITFNQDSSMCAVTSDHDTVHIFRLDQANGEERFPNVTSSQPVSSELSSKTSTTIKVYTSTSDIRCLLSNKVKSVAAFSLSSPNTLIVLDANGTYLKYSFFNQSGFSAKREMCVNFLNYNDDYGDW